LNVPDTLEVERVRQEWEREWDEKEQKAKDDSSTRRLARLAWTLRG